VIQLAPLLAFIKRPAVLGIAGALALAGVQTVRLSHAETELAHERQQAAEMALEHERSVAAAESAARERLRQAIAAQERLWRQLEKKERIARREAELAAEAAKKAANAWRKRYELAKKANPDCKAWSEGEIKCPVE
jgi:hypothetical protein